jgi:hypothetical protein
MSKYTDDLKLELATRIRVRILYRIRSGYLPIGLKTKILFVPYPIEKKSRNGWFGIESFRAWQQMTEPVGKCIMQNLIFRLFLLFSSKSGRP